MEHLARPSRSIARALVLALALFGLDAARGEAAPDHLECFRLRGQKEDVLVSASALAALDLATSSAIVAATEQGCRLLSATRPVPREICVPAAKSPAGSPAGNHPERRVALLPRELPFGRELRDRRRRTARERALHGDAAELGAAPLRAGRRLGRSDAIPCPDGDALYWDCDTDTCDDGEVCGHFTQVVWSGSTTIGCGYAYCGGQRVLVCNYAPGGNIIGERPFPASRCP